MVVLPMGIAKRPRTDGPTTGPGNHFLLSLVAPQFRKLQRVVHTKLREILNPMPGVVAMDFQQGEGVTDPAMKRRGKTKLELNSS